MGWQHLCCSSALHHNVPQLHMSLQPSPLQGIMKAFQSMSTAAKVQF